MEHVCNHNRRMILLPVLLETNYTCISFETTCRKLNQNCSLTKKQSADIERVQKVAFSINLRGITEESQYSHDMALVILGPEPLSIRGDKLCMNFAKMTLKSRHSDMFKMKNDLYNTRHKSRFETTYCNTNRYYNSSLNYLTRLLNQQ